MAKHRYSRKRRGQKRNKMRSRKMQGGFDRDEENRYESPPEELRLSDLGSYSSQGSQDTQGSQNNSFSQENLQSQGTQGTQGTNYDDYSLDSQNTLKLSDLDTTEYKKRIYDESFASQDPEERKRSKIDQINPKSDYESDTEDESVNEENAYQSDDEFYFNGGIKRRKRRTNKRKPKKSKKTRKNKKRRQRGGIIL